MVSELAKTEAGRREIIDKELRLRVVRKFDQRPVDTRLIKAGIVQFHGNRFRRSDAETEAMLRVSMEAIQDEW